MGWQKDMMRCWEQQKAFEREKVTTAINDIPVDVSGLTRLVISSDYMGPSPLPILHDVLKKTTQLRDLHIGLRLNWQDICSLDLSNIEVLSFSLKGVPTSGILKAERLRNLTIYADDMITPIEYTGTAMPHIDYSGVPNLTTLRLRYFPQIDPSDFRHLQGLDSLIIKGWITDSLKWLAEADYRLQRLFMEDVSVDCSDLVFQQELEHIQFHHSSIKRGEYLGKLPRLNYLDLTFCDSIESTCDLHELGIKKVYITNRDYAVKEIESTLSSYMHLAVRSIMDENDRIRKNEHRKPASLDHNLLQEATSPLKERIVRKIKQSYLSDLEMHEKSTPSINPYLSREEYISEFKTTATAYFPFLLEPNVEDDSSQADPKPIEEITAILQESDITLEAYQAFKASIVPDKSNGAIGAINGGFVKGNTSIIDGFTGEEISPEFLKAIDTLQNDNPTFRSSLASMHFLRFKDGILRVVVQKKNMMHMKLLERKTTILETAFSEAYGMPVRIEIELATK